MFRRAGHFECVSEAGDLSVPEAMDAEQHELRVGLPAGALYATQLQLIMESLLDRPDIASSLILFDFSAVCELAGLWSVHLALLINLSNRVGCKVRVTGLHGQPLDVAWLYRNSPEVRALLGARESSGQRHAA